MLGSYRYLLSFFVILAHLFPFISVHSGIYAVFGFYIISGYLMTLILDKNYGWNFGGVKRYYANRFLRVYPSYWFVAILSIIIIYILPEICKNLNPALILPSSFSQWIPNIAILGLGPLMNIQLEPSRLIPPAWALHTELCFYLIIPLLARNFKTVCFWFAISFIIALVLYIRNFSFFYHYFPLYAASLPFSIGSLIYYLKRNLNF
jgi:peptidoglycan/LPS O-acetylase OafA/YrhL